MLRTQVQTRHRTARSLHTQCFLACGSSLLCDAKCVPFLNINVCHSRASCPIRTRRGLIFHPFHFLSTFPLNFILRAVMNNHLIHAQQDGLIAWPYEVLLQQASAGTCPVAKRTLHGDSASQHHQGVRRAPRTLVAQESLELINTAWHAPLVTALYCLGHFTAQATTTHFGRRLGTVKLGGKACQESCTKCVAAVQIDFEDSGQCHTLCRDEGAAR